MACYPDLSPCPYFAEHLAPELTAVGWLGRELSYSRGPVSEAVLARLRELLADAWQPFLYRGRHPCDYCCFHHSYNLFVPGPDTVYATPFMVEHYIVEHEYCPPEAFQKAVLECPCMRSDEYFVSLHALAPTLMECVTTIGKLGRR